MAAGRQRAATARNVARQTSMVPSPDPPGTPAIVAAVVPEATGRAHVPSCMASACATNVMSRDAYSSGMNEGRVTDVKLHQRIMSGRAGIPFLRQRVVLIAYLRGRCTDQATSQGVSGYENLARAAFTCAPTGLSPIASRTWAGASAIRSPTVSSEVAPARTAHAVSLRTVTRRWRTPRGSRASGTWP
jgi:hypothetical protein